MREKTAVRIKAAARKELVKVGIDRLSMRSIAARVGLVQSAIYRYYASRDELVGALIIDAFQDLANELEQRMRQIEQDQVEGLYRWVELACTYRSWALSNPVQYALVYARPLKHSVDCELGIDQAIEGAVHYLFAELMRGIAGGYIDPTGLAGSINVSLRSDFEDWSSKQGLKLPPEALAFAIFAWTQMHGAILLEMQSHYPPELKDMEALFRHQMYEIVRSR